jgi:hypothetical protein
MIEQFTNSALNIFNLNHLQSKLTILYMITIFIQAMMSFYMEPKTFKFSLFLLYLLFGFLATASYYKLIGH